MVKVWLMICRGEIGYLSLFGPLRDDRSGLRVDHVVRAAAIRSSILQFVIDVPSVVVEFDVDEEWCQVAIRSLCIKASNSQCFVARKSAFHW